MEKAAYSLQSIQVDNFCCTLDINFLTGKKSVSDLFLCRSNDSTSSNNRRPVIYDDGTLAETYQDEILRFFRMQKLFY